MIVRQSGMVGIVIAGAALAATGVAAQQVDLSKVARLRAPAALTEQAPATFRANFDTSKGTFVIEVTPRLGADRRRPLLQPRQERLLRRRAVLPRDSRASWRSSASTGTRRVNTAWRNQALKDDPVKQSNKRGYVTFAHRGPEHADDAALHQLPRQRRQPRQAGLRAVRPGRRRAWTSSTRSTAGTARSTTGANPSRAASERGQRVPGASSSRSSTTSRPLRSQSELKALHGWLLTGRAIAALWHEAPPADDLVRACSRPHPVRSGSAPGARGRARHS